MYIQTILDYICFRLEMFDFAEVRVPGDGNCQVNFYFISISRIILGELDLLIIFFCLFDYSSVL